MICSILVPAGIGLLAGVFVVRVPFLVLASIVTVVTGVVLTPAGWWPLGGLAYVVAMLCALQFAYLAGYLVACALSRLRAGDEQKASVRERLNASFTGWLWPPPTDCSV
jgi:hypothetical protein